MQQSAAALCTVTQKSMNTHKHFWHIWQPILLTVTLTYNVFSGLSHKNTRLFSGHIKNEDMYVNVYPRHDGCGSIGVSSQRFVQLVQLLQYRSLVLVLPQAPGSDQPAVVIQRTAEPGGGHTALHLHRRRRLASRHRVT